MIKSNNRKANIKIYIIPFIIITLISVIAMITMSNSIKNYFYELKKEEALKIAKSISLDLSHTGVAVDTINILLEDKLINSLKAAGMHIEDYSNEYLIELATAFELDEVYIYSPEGIIEYSNSGKYIGWEAYKGHPVFSFMYGEEDILIEDIRRDSDSNMYYKYGYIKNPDGSFVQIGILAEKVHDLLEPVRLQQHLEEMIADGAIVRLSALNSDYIITASTSKDNIGLQMKDEVIISDINNGKIHDRINTINGVELYEIFVPLEYEADNIIAFEIQYSLNEMFPVIRQNTLIGVAGLMIVYISLIFTIFATYKRNTKLVELAYYDNLTGLPNSKYLKQVLGEDMIRNKDSKAILMIKCDNLNLINLTFGYEYGDMALKELGNRIRTLENKDIQLFRFTEEKILLYIKYYEEKEDLLDVIEKVRDLVEQPFIINGINEHMDVKIGVAEYSETENSLDQLLKNSTIALKYIDSSVTNNYSFFDEDMESNIQREEMIERELRDAISSSDTSKIYLVYQPIMDSRTNRIDGFEALARMNSDQFGSISPTEFIDIAERNQLIIPLSNFILRVTCTFISNLLKMGFNNIRVAVNISIIHLLQDNFVSTVFNIIEETGINGRSLELELTETIMMDNFQIVNEKLRELRANGIHISLDDFGTGYSSFDRLSELNVDNLKIDQYFINNINGINKDSLITKDIISIAHRLGLKTVAEGVELQAQKDYLLEYKCDRLQGYLFSKPVPEEEATMLLKNNGRNEDYNE
ncbi:bifunctional diguanylate cyclase/phosphodiesterase [Tissierella sp. Yu-01]|uniref:putative bifunctional diguanylate cyclase/phosphodiesterase n=1 Tax=Tissierella sp. Yu-01 TaxID=3035694 RepID=UPI00240D9713|nr:bifunctional diguanylate cyclase/phosphodiesterase [Tissierella sp. Yu-01]WFA07790.1 bifunctional diguanylate cyclase/phosphodiesterase [Tissierella sp. Yu-01]